MKRTVLTHLLCSLCVVRTSQCILPDHRHPPNRLFLEGAISDIHSVLSEDDELQINIDRSCKVLSVTSKANVGIGNWEIYASRTTCWRRPGLKEAVIWAKATMSSA